MLKIIFLENNEEVLNKYLFCGLILIKYKEWCLIVLVNGGFCV